MSVDQLSGQLLSLILFSPQQVAKDTSSESSISVETMINVEDKKEREESGPEVRIPAVEQTEPVVEKPRVEVRLSILELEESLKRELTLKRKEAQEVQAAPQPAPATASDHAPAAPAAKASKKADKKQDDCCVIA